MKYPNLIALNDLKVGDIIVFRPDFHFQGNQRRRIKEILDKIAVVSYTNQENYEVDYKRIHRIITRW